MEQTPFCAYVGSLVCVTLLLFFALFAVIKHESGIVTLAVSDLQLEMDRRIDSGIRSDLVNLQQRLQSIHTQE